MIELKKRFTTELFEAWLEVDETEDGKRLDEFLKSYLVSFSRQQIKKKITSGDIHIEGRPHPHKASSKVYHREVVKVSTHKGQLEDEYWRGKKLELQLEPEIIYEDEGVVIISKPPYMTTHPTGKRLFNCATVYFETKYKKTVHSVHRLDRETSGVMLLGKNPKAANYCTEQFENNLVKKCYFLIAKKKEKRSTLPFIATERLGNLDDFIPRLFAHCFDEDSHLGKSAKTEFKLITEDNEHIFALAFPYTGRQHQIRAHAYFHGYPLLGDKLYNDDHTMFGRFKDEIASESDFDKMEISRHALHALALKINYPKKDQSSIYRAPLPHDLTDWIKEKTQININDLEKKIDELIQGFF